MNRTYYFYDLETSGFSPREQRIMQFAGQRVDQEFKSVGEPDNFLIKMTDDILPDPEAILLTGITPQMTLSDGLNEAEFLKIFHSTIAIPGTVFVGFNSIRFDDEFMRFINYRNFYDAYEWHWSNDRGRWDVLDVVRMTRALRPEGVQWPNDSDGKPVNKLELLSSSNKLNHENAHDALSDVQATIALAQLIRTKQPKLFNFLLNMRDKKEVSKMVNSGKPFVYSSGKYPGEFQKTTVVQNISKHPKTDAVLVYDLRHDPEKYINLTPNDLAKLWSHYCKKYPCEHDRLPVKTMQFNRCPAIAPLSVLDANSQNRIGLSVDVINKNSKQLLGQSQFINNLLKALEILDKKQQSNLLANPQDVDSKLYDGFMNDNDKKIMNTVQQITKADIKDIAPKFNDSRLKELYPLYKARNFRKQLSQEEQKEWEEYKKHKLLNSKINSRASKYFNKLSILAESTKLSTQKKYLLEELQLYGQSIMLDAE